MSIRERVEEKLAHRICAQRNLSVHFSFGDPVVRLGSVLGPQLPMEEAAKVWAEITQEAREQYQTVLDTVDWNRLALEAVGAWLGIPGEPSAEFGDHPEVTGVAIRAALENTETFPDWSAYWAAVQREAQERTEGGLLH